MSVLDRLVPLVPHSIFINKYGATSYGIQIFVSILSLVPLYKEYEHLFNKSGATSPSY